jgi:hypothetical protein
MIKRDNRHTTNDLPPVVVFDSEEPVHPFEMAAAVSHPFPSGLMPVFDPFIIRFSPFIFSLSERKIRANSPFKR